MLAHKAVLLCFGILALPAIAAQADAGGPYIISNVHTGLVLDLLDRAALETTAVVANRQTDSLSISQLWYYGPWAANGSTALAAVHFPGADMHVSPDKRFGLLVSTTIPAASVTLTHPSGNVSLITFGGLAVTSPRKEGQNLRLAMQSADEERQQWRFTLAG